MSHHPKTAPGAAWPRSVLRVRERPHDNPERAGECIVEVLRAGEVVATIYGTIDGIHIKSDLYRDQRRNLPFLFTMTGEPPPPPGYVLPLLKPGERCPWCIGRGEMGAGMACPVCRVVEEGRK